MVRQKKGSDTFTIRIPDSLRDEMLKVCEEDKVTPSQLIREGVAIYLKIRLGNKQKREDDPKV